MEICIIHGYLLTGTGSNLYVNNLVKELCKAGHNVYLICQEPHPETIDYINEAYAFDKDNKTLQLSYVNDSPYLGKCKLFRPNLNGFLPVYVYDHYENFQVKEFHKCSNKEIEMYIEQNLEALKVILDRYKIDIIQTNHIIMSPYIVSQLPDISKYKHFIAIHGSALNFSLKKDKGLLLYAEQGLESAEKIFAASVHAKDELIEYLRENNLPELLNRIEIIYPGVDVENFNIPEEKPSSIMKKFYKNILPKTQQSKGRNSKITEILLSDPLPDNLSALEEKVRQVQNSYDYRYIDQNVIEKLKRVNWDKDNIILFLGKYLWTKGLYLLLFAIPEIIQVYPDTKFIFVGFGPFRESMEILLRYLSDKQLDKIRELFDKDSFLIQGDDNKQIPFLMEYLASEKFNPDTLESFGSFNKSEIKARVVFTGIVSHSDLGYILSCADILVAPSVFPEAFAMVVIEALASGVYPVVMYQSAFKEIGEEVKRCLNRYKLKIFDVYPDENSIDNIAKNIIEFIKLKDRLKKEERYNNLKRYLRSIVIDSYSWRAVANRYLIYYQDCDE